MGVRRYDLIVAGGGPAGTAAAITAARGGLKVLLLERGRLPRQKVCGEFVSAESVGLVKRLLGEDAEGMELLCAAVHVRRVRLRGAGRDVEAAIQPEALSLARYDLDWALWRAAERAGVACRQQAEVEGVECGAGSFGVRTSAGRVEAAAVVNAAGRWSRLKPLQEAPGAKWLGIKAHFAAALEEDADAVELYFFPGGYCGVQPVRLLEGGMRLNVCAMVRADVAATMEQVLAQEPTLWRRSRDWEQAGEVVATSPLRFAEPAPLREGVMQAGDAAGFIDPFLGDGIALALHSGCMAAEAAMQGEGAAETYRRRYERELLPAFRRAGRLRRGLRFPAVAVRLLQVPGVAEYVVRSTRVGRET